MFWVEEVIMELTKNWINKQIAEYQVLLKYVNGSDSSDTMLRGIYKATINTLTATLAVIDLETNHLNQSARGLDNAI